MHDTELSAWLSAGQTAQEAGRFADAAEAFARVRDALPGVVAVAQMVADAWRLSGDVPREREALRVVAQWASAEPAPVRFALGAQLLDAGDPHEALRLFDDVARERPTDPAVWGARASALRASGRPAEAWPLIERALRAAPRDPALLLTAGQVRHALGDLDGATAWLDRADAVRPQHALTRRQRALTSLMRGLSPEGWALFEARGLPDMGRRSWHGEPLADQSILVIADQGVGDHFHFVRYLPTLAARGPARVLLAAAPGTVRLFEASGIDTVTRETAPPTDWEVPLLSLPHRLGLGEDYGAAVPYLRVDTPMPSPAATRPRVGVVWKGNPAFGATVLRDFDAALLPALLATPHIDWVWLQYGDVPPAGVAVDTPPLSGDWLDTARLVKSLDAVVSVDTGLAHLAGALGVPTVVLLPNAPDWRWGWSGERTPWYPTMTLLRQPAPRDWASVLTAVQQRLAARFG